MKTTKTSAIRRRPAVLAMAAMILTAASYLLPAAEGIVPVSGRASTLPAVEAPRVLRFEEPVGFIASFPHSRFDVLGECAGDPQGR
jgi:hypothetical protein